MKISTEIFWQRLFFKPCFGNPEKYHVDDTCMRTCKAKERERCFVACYNGLLGRDKILARRWAY